ncbi:hypothetical protein Adt_37724 [Abeliophyllum distichum]|uniref:Uncharacterized protein n=1 Tax=Abeliophyllum distichum TaxID=126358 RepID=A0ABD1Q081_9LAMI
MRKITGHEADGKQQKLFPSLPLRPSFFTSAEEAFTEDGFQLRQRGPGADSPAVSQGFSNVAKGSLCRQSRRAGATRQSRRAGATGSREGQSRRAVTKRQSRRAVAKRQSRRAEAPAVVKEEAPAVGRRKGRATGSRAKEGKSSRRREERGWFFRAEVRVRFGGVLLQSVCGGGCQNGVGFGEIK